MTNPAPPGALDAILKPRSIAVVGASRTASTIGHQIVANLVRYGFTGSVYPVNPRASSIHSIRAYPTVADLPERPPVRMVARLTAAPVVFVHKSQATLNMNGEESQRTAITTWTFMPEGGSLTGTLERAIEGIEMQMGGPQALKGTRHTT